MRHFESSPSNPILADGRRRPVAHDLQLRRYGGFSGIRDVGLLDSAVAQASVTFGGAYLHADLASVAAAYLFSIVKNHPFLNGNKRAELASALTFLDLNGDSDRPFLPVLIRCDDGCCRGSA